MDPNPAATSAATPAANPAPRRSFLSRGLTALFGGAMLALLPGRSRGETPPAPPATPPPPKGMTGDVLHTDFSQGLPPIEPLDTMIRFQRSDNSTGRAMTHEILSLIHEEKGPNSYPWTIYSHLTTSHETGDACVHCSRLTKNGPGWSSGLHSEAFNHAPGVALGVNVEMTNHHPGPADALVIGVNVQAHGPEPCQIGIQVHDWEDGQFEKAIALTGARGKVGLDVAGTYGVGIHAHGNAIRVSEGTCVEFDDEGKIRMRYRKGRIEFLNGDRCVGHIDVAGDDHAL